jgi:hypothetical protein
MHGPSTDASVLSDLIERDRQALRAGEQLLGGLEDALAVAAGVGP